jgi:hypothetical protein
MSLMRPPFSRGSKGICRVARLTLNTADFVKTVSSSGVMLYGTTIERLFRSA